MPLKGKWDERYLALAKEVSTWSKDPSTQTGAVIVNKDNSVIAIGFNGFPKGIRDDSRLDNRELKYEIIIHCEVNALISAKEDISGCTLYTYPFLSCSRCCSIMIQAGIKRMVAPKNTIESWDERLELSKRLMLEAGIDFYEA